MHFRSSSPRPKKKDKDPVKRAKVFERMTLTPSKKEKIVPDAQAEMEANRKAMASRREASIARLTMGLRKRIGSEDGRKMKCPTDLPQGESGQAAKRRKR